MRFAYPVHITEAEDGVTVTFPDVPEAITQGTDQDEALLRAVDALESALEMYIEDGQDLPRPGKPKRGQKLVQPAALVTLKLHLYQEMRDHNVRKAELARRLQWHMPQVDRVLDLHHDSRLDQIEAAIGALGKRVEVRVQ
jgi:antitoxin HicB